MEKIGVFSRGLSVGAGDWPQSRWGQVFGVTEMFSILFVVVVTWLYTFLKIHGDCALKKGDFTLCKSYLKPNFKNR